jgi:hypothetical protein
MRVSLEANAVKLLLSTGFITAAIYLQIKPEAALNFSLLPDIISFVVSYKSNYQIDKA